MTTTTTTKKTTDSFEADEDEDEHQQDKNREDHDSDSAPRRASIDLQDLPIELISLTDSFIDSLGQKVHPTPPNIERLSQLFQEFYNVASSHVATHIKALATRQMRNLHQPSSSTTTTSTTTTAGGMMQQMMTAEELAERRKCRKQLEARRLYLEEAVERRLCEGIYHRIYRHPSTQDEAQDDKLRSKTAALALVGIGLSDLGVQAVVEKKAESQDATRIDGDDDDKKLVSAAHEHLVAMSESRYPLGKLNRLRAVHRSIVDALARIRPAASADELLPLLIYSLITLPPQHLHITSDLHFVQHFRHAHKLQGEEAYCLTNLEAAISFLQTVDLATLREDERLDGPPRSAASTPRAETFPPAYPTTPSRDPSVEGGRGGGGGLKPPPSHHHPPPSVVVSRGRSLSDLVNTPAQAFGAASGAVFNTADHGLKTISASLGDSYAFLVAKVRDGSTTSNTSTSSTSSNSSSSSSTANTKNVVTLPRTLDDARKLVTTPPPDPPPPQAEDVKQSTNNNNNNTPRRDPTFENTTSRSSPSPSPSPSKSASSPATIKRSSTVAASAAAALFSDDTSSSSSKPQSPAAVLDQVRSLGSSFNPMARLSGISIRRFGRTSTSSSLPASSSATAVALTASSSSSSPAKDVVVEPSDGGELTEAFPDLAEALPPKELPPSPRPHLHLQTQAQTRIPPPIRRFIEVGDPSDLRIGEVRDLLLDYRRLASALRNLGALEES
ncbi:hypothetical protein CP532_3440 [Ophiocordyceps camponoti-leonardi (nom. inval.)]|nr:hypothetical protein CP532_3440 [Ophiocordyceps camponoti-leonardi (nom. inval.)]